MPEHDTTQVFALRSSRLKDHETIFLYAPQPDQLPDIEGTAELVTSSLTVGEVAAAAVKLDDVAWQKRIGLSKIVSSGPALSRLLITSKDFFATATDSVKHIFSRTENTPGDEQIATRIRRRFSGAFFSNYMRFGLEEAIQEYKRKLVKATTDEEKKQAKLEFNLDRDKTMVGVSGSWFYESDVKINPEESEKAFSGNPRDLLGTVTEGLYEAYFDMEVAAQVMFYKLRDTPEMRDLLGIQQDFTYEQLYSDESVRSGTLAQFIEILNSQSVYEVNSSRIGQKDWGPVRAFRALVTSQSPKISARRDGDRMAFGYSDDATPARLLGKAPVSVPVVELLAELNADSTSEIARNQLRDRLNRSIENAIRNRDGEDQYSRQPIFEIKVTTNQDSAEQLELEEFSAKGAICKLILIENEEKKLQQVKVVFNHFHCSEKQGQYILYKLHKQLAPLGIDLVASEITPEQPKTIYRAHDDEGYLAQMMSTTGVAFSTDLAQLFKVGRKGTLSPSQSALIATAIAGLNETTVFNCVDPKVGDLTISLFPTGTDLGKLIRNFITNMSLPDKTSSANLDEFLNVLLEKKPLALTRVERLKKVIQKVLNIQTQDLLSGPVVGEQNKIFKKLQALYSFSDDDTKMCQQSAGLLQVLDSLNAPEIVASLRTFYSQVATVLEGGTDQISSIGHFDTIFKDHIGLSFFTGCSPQASRGVALDSSPGGAKRLTIRERHEWQHVRAAVAAAREASPELSIEAINTQVEAQFLHKAKIKLMHVRFSTILASLALITVDPEYSEEVKASAKEQALGLLKEVAGEMASN